MEGENGPQFFYDNVLMWHSINESECKVELNFDNFSDRKCCFDVMCLILLHFIMLG